MKRTTALFGSAVLVAATMLATVPMAANAAPLTHDQQLALVPPAVTAAGLQDDQLSVWYLDSSNVLHVGLTSYTDAQAASLRTQLGSSVVITQQEQVKAAVGSAPTGSPAAVEAMKSVTPRLTSTATADKAEASAASSSQLTPGPYEPFLSTPNWVGGLRIVRQSGGTTTWCTMSTKWAGKMLTAGHCGPNGASWDQGYYDGSLHSAGPAGTAGSVHWEADNPDVALLSGGAGFDPGVYLSGDNGNVTYAHVAGAAVSQVGTQVCTDGSVTGYTCGATVTIVNGCISMTEGSKTVHECGMDAAKNATNVVTQPGDSGVPVVTKASGGSVVYAGPISGETDSGHTVWYSDISRVKQMRTSSVTVG